MAEHSVKAAKEECARERLAHPLPTCIEVLLVHVERLEKALEMITEDWKCASCPDNLLIGFQDIEFALSDTITIPDNPNG